MRTGLLFLVLAGLLAAAVLLRETRSPSSDPSLMVLAAEGAHRAPADDRALSLATPDPSKVVPERRRADKMDVKTRTSFPAERAAGPELHPIAARVVRTSGEPVVTAQFVNPRGGDEVAAQGDENGNYELRLPAGSWTLAAMSESPRLVADTGVLEDSIEVPYVGRPLVFVLHEPANLDGLVVDAAGAPVPGAEVRVGPPSIPERYEQSTTDEAGRFRFEELPIGDVVLVARYGELEAGRTATLREGQNTTAALELPPGGWLVVFALDESGAPRDDVRTILFRDSRQIGNAEEPGVRYGPLPSGPVEVLGIYPRDESTRRSERVVTQRVEVLVGEVTEVHLAPAAAHGVVEGVVRRAGAPYASGVILAFLEGGALTENVRLLRTDEFGHYRLELPHPAAVVFAIDLEGHVRVISHLPQTDLARVQHDIDIAAARLTGRIEGIEPGEGWGVLLQSEPRAIELDVPGGRSGGGVNEDGTFEFRDLRPGTYRLWAGEEDGGVAGPVKVELRADRDVTDVVLVRRAATTLSGRVRDGAGRPVARAVVHVRTCDGHAHPMPSRTDAAGRFQITWLVPGEVVVCAQSDEGVGTARLRLEPGRSEELEVTLAPGARIRVRARGPAGAARVACLRIFDVHGAEVSSFRGPDGSSDSYSAVVSTSERVFGPLSPGRYAVVAETIDGSIARREVALGARDLDVDLEL